MKFKESRIYQLSRREVIRMMQRPLYLLCMIGAPLFCFIYFTSLMKEGLPQDLPAGVVDDDNTAVTRRILRNLDSFQQTQIVNQYPNFIDARNAMQRGEIYGIYYIPKGTTQRAQRFEQAHVSFYTNAAYLVPASLLYRDMTMMSEYASAGVGREMLMAKGYTMDQAMGFLQPIKMDMRAIGNPWLSYSIYLNNTLIPAIIMLMIMLVTAYSVHTELKDGSSKAWLEMAGDNIYMAVAGKLLPQTLVFCLMLCGSQIWLYGYLAFPLNGPIWSMILAGILLVLASEGFTLFICSAIPSLRWSLSLSTLWGVLSIPIAGFSFPVMAMPPTLKALSYMFPLRYYFLIYVDQALDGLPIHYSSWFYLALLGFALMPLVDLRLLRHAALHYEYTY